jgi:hypothetical protein
MTGIMLAANALIAIAVMLLSVGVQKLYKAQAAENAALRHELNAMKKHAHWLTARVMDWPK